MAVFFATWLCRHCSRWNKQSNIYAFFGLTDEKKETLRSELICPSYLAIEQQCEVLIVIFENLQLSTQHLAHHKRPNKNLLKYIYTIRQIEIISLATLLGTETTFTSTPLRCSRGMTEPAEWGNDYPVVDHSLWWPKPTLCRRCCDQARSVIDSVLLPTWHGMHCAHTPNTWLSYRVVRWLTLAGYQWHDNTKEVGTELAALNLSRFK